MKQRAYFHFLALAWLLVVFWIDAANCLFCKEITTFSSTNICTRFNINGGRISIKVGCMNWGTGVAEFWNENTCQIENYCDCEYSRQKGKEGQPTIGKHGPGRCCELRKDCRSDSCKKGEICRENVHKKGFWCDKECYNSKVWGHDYRGKVQVTESGRVCRPWNGHKHFYNSDEEKFKKYDLRKNYCRNPSWASKKDPGIRPWCYTDEPGTRNGEYWEYCDIPTCKDPEAKDQQRHQAETMERRGKLRARTKKTGFNSSILSDWLKLVMNV